MNGNVSLRVFFAVISAIGLLMYLFLAFETNSPYRWWTCLISLLAVVPVILIIYDRNKHKQEKPKDSDD